MTNIRSWSRTDNSLTAVVLNEGKNVVVRTTRSQPGWEPAQEALNRGDGLALIDACSVGRTVERFTDGNVEVKDGNVFYKGRQLFGLDVTRLLEYIRDNVPYLRLLRFLERKQANPSYRSINELYKFLEYREMTLTESGTVIGYKGVRDDYYSIMGNTATVMVNGTVDAAGHILNKVGENVRCDRSCVDDDYREGCRPGLHIGSLAYAKGWGPRVMIVEFDPADVVSVPDDCECQKLRACAYKVVGEYTGELVTELNSLPNKVASGKGDVQENVTHNTAPNWDHWPDEEEELPTKPTASGYDNNAYDEGFELGSKEGKAHKARRHYATDEDNVELTFKELSYIKGYNDGYARGRYHK
jgi:hypothetical protein